VAAALFAAYNFRRQIGAYNCGCAPALSAAMNFASGLTAEPPQKKEVLLMKTGNVTGLVGWRGMVGSVLMGRMIEEKDFDLIEPVFFSTSNAGAAAPAMAKNEKALKDAHDIEALKKCDIIITAQGGDYTTEVFPKLRAAGWKDDAPMLVVQKASWPGHEKIVRGTLADIKQKCQAEKIGSQAMIVASPTLGAADWTDLVRSKLYDPAFGHRFRKAAATPVISQELPS
jgi:hypothetical protein